MVDLLVAEDNQDKTGRNNMGIKDKAIKAGKSALRGAYRKSLGPQANMLQKGLDFVAPNSRASRAVSAIVDPKILGGKGGGPKTASKTNPKKVKETSPKNTKTKVKGKSSKGKVGKNRESDTSNFDTVMTTTRMPGEAIAPKTRRMPSRMKGGGEVMNYKSGGTVPKSKATGAAKRGFGKAYMKGKR